MITALMLLTCLAHQHVCHSISCDSHVNSTALDSVSMNRYELQRANQVFEPVVVAASGLFEAEGSKTSNVVFAAVELPDSIQTSDDSVKMND